MEIKNLLAPVVDVVALLSGEQGVVDLLNPVIGMGEIAAGDGDRGVPGPDPPPPGVTYQYDFSQDYNSMYVLTVF